jgi:hypothetical protein
VGAEAWIQLPVFFFNQDMNGLSAIVLSYSVKVAMHVLMLTPSFLMLPRMNLILDCEAECLLPSKPPELLNEAVLKNGQQCACLTLLPNADSLTTSHLRIFECLLSEMLFH